MIQSKRVSKIVNILILIMLITTMFFTGSVVAEVDVPTTEPEQTIEPSEDTNLQAAPTDVKQLPAGQAEYTEEYYYEQLDGNFLLVKTETKIGTIGTTVTMNTSLDTEFWKNLAVGNPDSFSRYHFVTSSQLSHQNIVKADGSLILSMYVKRRTEVIWFYGFQADTLQRVDLKYGDHFIVPLPPYREGCQFTHWAGLPTSGSSVKVKSNAKQVQTTVAVCETIVPSGVNIADTSLSNRFLDGLWNDNFGIAFWPIYVSAPPTPTPVTTPTPEPVTVPTPNPGRTCQDDGYADGYTWNGTACVLPEVYVVPNTAAK